MIYMYLFCLAYFGTEFAAAAWKHSPETPLLLLVFGAYVMGISSELRAVEWEKRAGGEA
jgi:hypothetical protein